MITHNQSDERHLQRMAKNTLKELDLAKTIATGSCITLMFGVFWFGYVVEIWPLALITLVLSLTVAKIISAIQKGQEFFMECFCCKKMKLFKMIKSNVA